MNYLDRRESRLRQVELVKEVLAKLHDKGFQLEDVQKMNMEDLQENVKNIRPRKSWSMPRFAGMIKHITKELIDWMRA